MALISGIWRNRDSHALDRDRFQSLRSPELPQTPWAALLPYLVSGSVGRIALEWWPLTRLCASFGISGRVTQTASLSLGSLLCVLDLAFVDRSLLHCWRCADLVFHPASFMAQPKALDCRSLRLHDYRSRVLDSPPQRCVSSVPWVYLGLSPWPPHRRHPSCVVALSIHGPMC